MSEFNTYDDAPSYHVEDERALNVAERIKELETQARTPSVNDDSTEKNELERAIESLRNSLSGTSLSIATMSAKIGTVQEGHTVCGDIDMINENLEGLSQSIATLTETISESPKILKVNDIEGVTSSEVITTADLYTALKAQMHKGDIFVGQVNLTTDGPAGFTAEGKASVGIFAYAVVEGVEGVYARVYMIATSKTSSDIYSCQVLSDVVTWVKMNV